MATQVQMLKYLNLAREYPSYYISLLDKQYESFINEYELPVSDNVLYETTEGKKLWREARLFLENQSKLSSMDWHEGLHLSASDHAQDLAKNGMFGHTGSDKSNFSERILRHCRKGHGAMAEIIGADFLLENRNNAELTVLGLIIDDGVMDRGHRKTIFNPSYKYVGCKSAIQNDKVITVFNFTENKLALRMRNESRTSNNGFRMLNTAPVDSPTIRRTSSFGKDEKPVHYPHQQQSHRSPMAQKERDARNVIRSPSPQPFTNISNDWRFQSSPHPIYNASNSNVSPMKHQPQRPPSMSPYKQNKRVLEKSENTKVFYEQGNKVTETVTRLYFNDGSVEENIDKHTTYC